MASRTFKDQTGYSFLLKNYPQRIISLVPSQTELLYYLGLENEILGVTKFCLHPENLVRKAINIGGTKKFNFKKIDELKPDLILANKEENYKEGINLLREKYPVWTSDIYNIDDSLKMINEVGKMTGKDSLALTLSSEIKIKHRSALNIHSGDVLYFIWQKPYMLAANNTFIDAIINDLGFNNLAAKIERYPEMTESELSKLNPDYVFLSSEPFPFKEKHIAHFQKIFPTSRIILVDGEMFSWYGNRLLLAFDYFKQILRT